MAAAGTNPINSVLLNAESISSLRAEHDQSAPYRHLVLKDICEFEQLSKVHKEIKLNLKANFKETDLFKVYQTAELAALDEEILAKMPTLHALRDQIYSKKFRKFVSDITGCGALTDRIDCSVNAYANGCHLLTHDDVIGTRCVSYIIYLSDPDQSWTADDGGAVELYPLDPSSIVTSKSSSDRGKHASSGAGEQGIPVTVPTTCVLPSFNTMLLFTVQPGRSYHAVQEVFSPDKPRLSISGWYHAKNPPAGSDRSSLMQIMTTGDDNRQFQYYSNNVLDNTKVAVKNELTDAELTVLKKWINSEYLNSSNLRDVNIQFCNESSLQLTDFLRIDLAAAVNRFAILADHHQRVGKGVPQLQYTLGQSPSTWRLVGPPHKRRYLQYNDAFQSDALSSDSGLQSSGKKRKTSTTKNPPFDAAVKLIDAADDSSNWNEIADQIYDSYLEQLDGDAGQAACETIGQLLSAIRKAVFQSPEFGRLLAIITTLQPLGYRDEVRRFRAGLDYTVAHYGVLTKEARLDATLCFVNESEEAEEKVLSSDKSPEEKKKKAKVTTEVNEEDDDEEDDDDEDDKPTYEEAWESDDVGGFECYIEADEDPENSEAAEVYRVTNANPAEQQQRKSGANTSTMDEDGGDPSTSVLSVSARSNVLSLVLRDEGIMKFIKYVSANAPGSRWDITVEYEVKESEGSDDSSGTNDEKEGSRVEEYD